MSHEATGDTAVEAGFGDVLSEKYLIEEPTESLLQDYLLDCCPPGRSYSSVLYHAVLLTGVSTLLSLDIWQVLGIKKHIFTE